MKRRDFTFGLSAGLIATAAYAELDGMRMRVLYNRDLSFSDKAKDLEGSRVEMTGFMAPPLKADANFFVLARVPMAVCPFCESEADWPDDIMVVYLKRRLVTVPYHQRIDVSGILELGPYIDPDTGFFSKLRLTKAVVET